MRRPFLLAVALCVAACGGGEGEGPRGCEPGTSASCECAGGGEGTASCGADRVPGSCVCPGGVAAAPASVDFGSVPRGETREATLLLATDGDTPVAVIDAVVEGDAGFAVVSLPEAVPAGGAGAPLVVSFRSAAPVVAEATLIVRTGAGDVAVPLRAGVYGSLVTCTEELLWRDIPLGTWVSRFVVCRNDGLSGPSAPGSAYLNDVSFGDPEFSTWSLGESEPTVAPGEELSIEILYRPVDLEDDLVTARLEFFEDLAGSFEREVVLDAAASNPPCDLELAVDALSGVPGQELFGLVSVRNNRTDAGCLLARFELDPACDPGFSLPDVGTEPVLLQAGKDLPPELLSFVGETAGVYDCTLRLVTDDPAGTVFAATTTARLSWRSCLQLEGPATVPAVSPSCGVSEVETWLTNTCQGDFLVDTVALTEDSAPAFTLAPVEPTTLAPGESLTLPVSFDPEDVGASFEATVEVRSRLDPEPWSFRLHGASGPDDLFKDRHVQVRLEPVDVLVVIDNGVGMAAEAPRIVTEMAGLPDHLRGYDYHLAVTTTGLVPQVGGGCPGGANGGEDGRFFPVDGSRPRVVTRATPDAGAVWAQNLQVGTCQTAAARPFAAAALALSPPLVDVADDPRYPEANDGNAGFLRPGVPLVVVVVTDRDDASPGTVAAHLNALVAAKGGDPTLVNVWSIAGDPGTGCVGGDGISAVPADRVHQLIVAAGGGAEISICDGTWGFLNLFPDPLVDCFDVSEAPADRNEDGAVTAEDLIVRVGFTEVPPTAPDGTPFWFWNATSEEVCFVPSAVPPASSLVEIERLYCER